MPSMIWRAFAFAAFSVPALLVSRAAAGAGTFGGSLGLTSDYVYQGLSLTCGGPAVQADVHYQIGPAQSATRSYLGVWGSAGLGGDPCRQDREIDLYAGQRFAVGADSSLTLSYAHYAYPGGSYVYEPLAGRRYDYDQLGISWAYQDRLYLSAQWTPNAVRYEPMDYYGSYFASVRRAGAFSGGVQFQQPLARALSLAVGAGYDQVYDPSGAGYAFGSAALIYSLGRLDLSAAYFRTAPRAERIFGPYVAGGRGSATLVWRF
jgi:uncharacterized protein (TIGR02001 family)